MNFQEFYNKRRNIKPRKGGDLFVFYGPSGLIKSPHGLVKLYAYTPKQAVFKFKKMVPFYKFLKITAQTWEKYKEILERNNPKDQTPIQKSVQKDVETQLNLDI